MAPLSEDAFRQMFGDLQLPRDEVVRLVRLMKTAVRRHHACMMTKRHAVWGSMLGNHAREATRRAMRRAPPSKRRKVLRAGTAGLAKGLGTEGLTEGAQEGISIAAERFIDDNPGPLDRCCVYLLHIGCIGPNAVQVASRFEPAPPKQWHGGICRCAN